MAFEYTEPLGNITSADATMIMTVEGLYPVGIPITNFSVDQMADSDEHEYAAGFVPNAWNVTVSLEASSPSLKVMQQIAQAMATNRRTYEIGITLTIPSLKQVHMFKKGVLLSGKDMPGIRKTLEPTSWKFTFARYNQLGI